MIQREYQMNNGFSTGEEDSRGNSDQICCLVDDSDRCRRSAGNAAYSKRIQKTVTQRRLKLSIDPQARHTYICDYHKNMIQCARTKQRRPKDSEDDSNEAEMDSPEVDWFSLQVNTLRRYKRHYKVPTRPGFNKAQLADDFSSPSAPPRPRHVYSGHFVREEFVSRVCSLCGPRLIN
ncbi:histone deacetylase complex subunit SAP30 homolog isoform X2 [Cydia pomonella]|uniref:histone deacetylase complex subunit SAP30 homolog isoform X2 n=1 Tax=Cydia pomonella TaxID=82600 RepID=UPI002ADD7C72|nr:histone deacetylase complex subunit SAP30 homolog isoform X2 [Cydia pomonella]